MRLGRYTDVWQGIAAAAPDRPAVVSRARRLTYRELTAEAGAVARFFERAGVRPGDSVAIYTHNRPELLTVLYACLATGVAAVPINFRYRASELRDLLIDAEARVLVYPASLRAAAMEAATEAAAEPAGLDPPPVLVQLDEEGLAPRAVAYRDVIAEPGSLPRTPPPGGELRLYTGGTTGSPKAVVWDADRLLEGRLFSTYTLIGSDIPETVAEAVAIAVDPATPRVATLPLAPLIHGTALISSINTLALGGNVIIHAAPHFDPVEALRLIHDEGATRLVLAGEAVAQPLVAAAERAGSGLGHVRSVISSGMRLTDETKRRLHALTDLTIVDLLASAEGGPFATAITNSATDLPARLRLMPDAAVLDDDGAEVQGRAGAVGRLAYRGALPKGYFRAEAKTRAAFPEIGSRRYVVPGDWARVLDDEGHIELLGRGSAVVNTGGEKVYPAEVEQALLQHPDVDDAVVFGMPDSRFGEVVTAVVVPASGASIDLEELAGHLDERLAGYKKPRRILVRDSLGRSPHGKVNLTRLKQDAAATWHE